MKRIVSICLAITILLVAMPVATSVALSQYGTVTGGWLRLRSSPSFDASTINSYYTGTQVKILATSGSWYQVETPDSKTGYMYASYISFSGGGGGSAYVTSSNGLGVRMRSGPGTGYSIIGVYSVGTAVTVLQSGSTWSKIQIGSRVGYMMNKFLTTGGGGGGGTGESATIWSANGYGVRLRSGPGTGYAILGVYSVGTLVTVQSHSTTWDYISVGSRSGYMMNQYLIYNTSKTVTAVTLNNSTPVVGSELQAASITPSGAKVTYAWYAGSTLVGEAEKYTVSYDDLGKQIKLKVTGTDTYTGSATSAPTSTVVEGAEITSGVLNNPSPVVGDVLRVVNLEPVGAKATYKWYVGGTLAGSSSTYTVASGDLNKAVSVDVTGTGLYTGTFTINADNTVRSAGTVDDVTIANTTNPTDIGLNSPNVGDVLAATPVPATATVSYKWTYEKDDGTVVTLGTASKLTVPTATTLVGKAITVTITGTGKYAGTGTPAAQTGPVVNLKNLSKVELSDYAPKLDESSGTASTITATVYAVSTTAPVTDNCTIAWYRGDTLTDTTGDTYTLGTEDCGYLITAVATADGINNAGTVSRATTSKVRRRLYKVEIADQSGSPVTAVSVGDVLTGLLNDNTLIEPNNQYMTLSWMFNGTTTKTLEYTVPASTQLTGGLTLTITIPTGSIYYIEGTVADSISTVNKAIITLPNEADLTAPVAGETYTFTVTPETAKATYVWKNAAGTTLKTTSTPSWLIPSTVIGQAVSVTVTPGTGYALAEGAPDKLTTPTVEAQTFTAQIYNNLPPNANKLSIVTDPANATVESVNWYDFNGNSLGQFAGRNYIITNSALLGTAFTAVVHGGGNFKRDVNTTEMESKAALEALMAAYDPALEQADLTNDGTAESTDNSTPSETAATETPAAEQTSATETPAVSTGETTPATDATGEQETPATDGDAPATDPITDEASGQTDPAAAEQTQPAITYAAWFDNLPATVTADTRLQVKTNADDAIQSYAWYRGVNIIQDVLGSTYDVAQSDVDAGSLITVYVTFTDGAQAYASVKLIAPVVTDTQTVDTGATGDTLSDVQTQVE